MLTEEIYNLDKKENSPELIRKEVNMKRKRWVIAGISLLALLLSGGALAYVLRPLPYQKNVPACTLDGDVIELELDVTLRRSVGKPARLHGQITIDGVEYVSFVDLHPRVPIQGDGGNCHLFFLPGYDLMEESSHDHLLVMPIGDDLDCFWFGFVRSGETTTYFCPAGSPAEAQDIADRLTTR